MYLSRRLKRARRTAHRDLARITRRLDIETELFNERAREVIGRKVEACEAALKTDDPRRIEAALAECKATTDAYLPAWRRSNVRENVEVVLVALLLFIVIRTFVVQAFKIPSGSMIPTLRVGDHILVNKFIYGINIPFTDWKIPLSKPRRGDVVVFLWPVDQKTDYIKRVVGVPGDVVKIKGDSLWINGELVDKRSVGTFRYEDPPGYELTGSLYAEDFGGREHRVLYDADTVHTEDRMWRIPEGKYFCMGDNRDHSNDSRFWRYVPEENIVGKAMVIYFSWPPGQFSRIARLLR
ncbi:MAG: signal peptidase I [Candidatus Lernaella stagnicola]|nr:signal peptidase I [Candidatus Lernaella stagnicola]